MKLVHYTDPALHAVCREVTPEEIPGVLALFEPMRALMDSVAAAQGMTAHGLAANQVGDLRRFFITRTHMVINPELYGISGDRISKQEGCLSRPRFVRFVKRPETASVGYTGLFPGKSEPYPAMMLTTLQGLEARVFLHELDHLNGRNIWDRR